MTKKELIDRIVSVNRGATREFLAEFAERELSDYVRLLHSLGADSGRLTSTIPPIHPEPQGAHEPRAR